MPKPILIFDSGMGGLSVLQEIRQQRPDLDYCYLFDNARLPYGELDEPVLIQGCVELVVKAVQRVDAALVVIACNTASTLVLETLRAKLTIPVVGVVPAIKPAAQLSQSKHIGLLATPGTIRRTYTHELIAQFAQDCKVELIGSSELVLMAERKMAGQNVDMSHFAEILKPLTALNLDVLVLGCTHFPLLAEELQQTLGGQVTLLDSGSAIAKRVQALLSEANETQGQAGEAVGVCRAWYTTEQLSNGLRKTLVANEFTSVQSFIND